MPLSWLDRKLDTISDPPPFLPSCSNRKWNSATHNRWRHLSLVGQTYLLLLVSSTLWTIRSFYNCLLKCNHFIRAQMQVLKCCCWWGTNAGTSVTVPLCSHVTAHVHRKNGTETKHTKGFTKHRTSEKSEQPKLHLQRVSSRGPAAAHDRTEQLCSPFKCLLWCCFKTSWKHEVGLSVWPSEMEVCPPLLKPGFISSCTTAHYTGVYSCGC